MNAVDIQLSVDAMHADMIARLDKLQEWVDSLSGNLTARHKDTLGRELNAMVQRIIKVQNEL